jgi:L-phenylalanine/L-methionine N-acetyltransferase
MSIIRVRAREPRDVEAIAEIMACPGVIAGTLRLPFRSVEELRARDAQPQPESHSLVAEIDGRVAGLLGLHVETVPRRRHCGSMGMMVHDDLQGRGVGNALMAAVVDLADNWLGLQRVELTVYTDNAPAIHLYQKFGFVVEGTARQYALRHGQLVDAYYMARLRSI